jgi:hypothetical protein
MCAAAMPRDRLGPVNYREDSGWRELSNSEARQNVIGIAVRYRFDHRILRISVQP